MAWWFIAIWVVALIAGAAIASRPRGQNQPALEAIKDFKVPTAEAGKEIPVVFGTREIKNYNSLWYGDIAVIPLKKKGGKK